MWQIWTHLPWSDRISAFLEQRADKMRSSNNLSFHLFRLSNQLNINSLWKPLVRWDFPWAPVVTPMAQIWKKSACKTSVNKCTALHRSVKNNTSACCKDIYFTKEQAEQAHLQNTLNLILEIGYADKQTKEKFHLGNMFHFHFITSVLETFAEEDFPLSPVWP